MKNMPYRDRDKKIEYNKRYYQKNKDRIKKNAKIYAEENIDDIRKKSREYHSRNRIKCNYNRRIRWRKYYEDNKGFELQRKKLYYSLNKKEISEKGKIYRENNKEKIKIRHKLWYQLNKKEINKRALIRRNSNMLVKFKHKVSAAIRGKLKQRLILKKGKRTWDFLPYTVDELIQHLEKLFQPGMTWQNYGYFGWHIDHKIADCKFNYKSVEDEEFQKCWALENLQPLWAEDNFKKNRY